MLAYQDSAPILKKQEGPIFLVDGERLSSCFHNIVGITRCDTFSIIRNDIAANSRLK
jgi:hypothetical protein